MRANNTPDTPQTGPGQVARLNADPDFMKKYLGGDRDAMKRMDDAINAAARGQ